MTAYRKLPVVVEAWTVAELTTAMQTEWGLLPLAIRDAHAAGHLLFTGVDSGIDVLTLEGWAHAPNGHWIIQGVVGELHPCDPDVFTATYELVV